MTPISLSVDLPAPPARVWRALTTPDLLGRWLLPGELVAVAGASFSLRGAPPAGRVHGEVIEADAPRHLRLRWRTGELDTVVDWTLEELPTGTRLHLVHSGFPDGSGDAEGAGVAWNRDVEALRGLLPELRESIVVETRFAKPPARVWDVLTRQMGAWLLPCDFRAEVGHRFQLDMGQWGTTTCEVLAVDPARRLHISWVNPPLDTTVTWTLHPDGDGTRLLLEHDGFDAVDPHQRFAITGMGQGWPGILARLGAML